MAEEDQDIIWPPAPTNRVVDEPPIPDPKQTVGRIALVCSSLGLVPFILVHGLYIRPHSTFLSFGGVPILLAGLVLGLISLRTLFGRVALLGPLACFGYVLYLLLIWYGILPL